MTTQTSSGYRFESGSLYKEYPTHYSHVCKIPAKIQDIESAIAYYLLQTDY